MRSSRFCRSTFCSSDSSMLCGSLAFCRDGAALNTLVRSPRTCMREFLWGIYPGVRPPGRTGYRTCWARRKSKRGPLGKLLGISTQQQQSMKPGVGPHDGTGGQEATLLLPPYPPERVTQRACAIQVAACGASAVPHLRQHLLGSIRL